MSRRAMTKGTCQLCQGVFGKIAMAKHLPKCMQESDKYSAEISQSLKKGRVLQILVDDPYSGQYWMHLAVPTTISLQALDNFLRGIWVECCGHLSNFEIAGIRYEAYPSDMFEGPGGSGLFGGMREKSMHIQTGKVLQPDMQFSYEYDYGSTTELRLKVIAEYETRTTQRTIQLLARNEPPHILCNVCGKEATQICTECIYDDAGWLCEECAQEHECGEDMLLPVVNSPRVGVCGYTGAV
jgi:hypothetical protein